MDYKSLFGALASLFALIAYVPYIYDIFRGRTRPHAFSWFVWFLMTLIGLMAQLSDNAGPGTWPVMITTVSSFIIFIAGLVKGKYNIVRSDWYSLSGALVAIVLWAITKNPLTSVVLVVLTDLLAFIPTFRKSYGKPYEETLISYVINTLKHGFSILALNKYSFTTSLYPSYLTIINALFTGFLIIRRKKVAYNIKRKHGKK